MSTFPQTATLGHAAMHYPPAKPLHKLHEVPIGRSIRKPLTRYSIHQVACTDEEAAWLAKRLEAKRAGEARKRAKVSRPKDQ